MQVSTLPTPLRLPVQQLPGNTSRTASTLFPNVHVRSSAPIGEFACFTLSYANVELASNKYTPFNTFRSAIEESKLDPNQEFSKRPLIIHAALGCFDTRQKIKYLLDIGANPNGQDRVNGSAAHIFIANERHDDAVNFIQEATLPERVTKLNVNSTDYHGNNLCMLAVKMRSTAAALLLIEKGADCAACDGEGRTALHYAVISGNIELFSALINKNPELLNKKDCDHRSPLDYLLLPVKDRKAITIALLESCRIDPNRDEMASNNHILDIDRALIVYQGQRIFASKAEGEALLSQLKEQGARAYDSISYSDQTLAYIAGKVASFTGKSLLDICIRQQANMRGTYLPQQPDKIRLATLCSELNKRMKDIGVEFELRCKQYLPGFIDLVTVLPSGKEQATIKCIKKRLPQVLLTRHFESASVSTQFYAIEHVHLIEVQCALKHDDMPNPMSPAQACAAGFSVMSTQGRPEHGTVLHLGQTHSRENVGTAPEIHAVILRSQKALYDELIKHRPKHVFSEGESKTRSNVYCALNLIKTFKDYRPGNRMSIEQVRALDIYSATGLYLLLHADVTIHATTTEEFNKKAEKYVQANPRLLSIYEESDLTAEDKRVMFDEREQLTMNMIKQFHQAHPGVVAALIFGNMHASRDFLKHCNQSDYSPQFYFKDCSAN